MKKFTLAPVSLALAGAAAAQATGGRLHRQPRHTRESTRWFQRASHAGHHGTKSKTLPDDAQVTMRGSIESHLGGKIYIFKDAIGTVPVEIKSKRWESQSVSPQDLVEIEGEVERECNTVEIEVKRLRKL